MDCLKAVRKGRNNRTLCKNLREESQKAGVSECHCEEQTCSPQHSPGCVKDEEDLIRIIFSPHDYLVSEERLVPTAFDDMVIQGWSVLRKKYTSVKQIEQRADTIMKGKGAPASVQGVIIISSRDLRKIRTSLGQRELCVLDTAQQTVKSHADVCQATETTLECEEQLFAVCGKLIPLNELAALGIPFELP